MADTFVIDFEDMSPPQFLHAARKAVQKTKADPVRSRMTLTALIQWVDNNPIRFSHDSAMGRLVDVIMRFDDDEELDDNDVAAFMHIVGDFFRAVSAKDIADVENWEKKTNMSPNLLALFGGTAKASNAEVTDWKAPSKSGMDNSAAIVPTDKNAYKEVERRHDHDHDSLQADSKSGPSGGKHSKSSHDEDEEQPEDDPRDQKHADGGDNDEEEDEEYDYEDEKEEEEESKPPAGKYCM